MDLKHLLSLEKAEIKAQIAFYKKYRSVFQYGTFKRLNNGWQVSQGKTTIAGVFRKQISAAPGYEQLRVKGLDRAKHYQLANREQKLRVGQFGALINNDRKSIERIQKIETYGQEMRQTQPDNLIVHNNLNLSYNDIMLEVKKKRQNVIDYQGE